MSGNIKNTEETSKSESTVQYSETKTLADTFQASLSDRLAKSLLSAGLIRGIIPLSMRRRSGQQMLDTAFLWPDGDDAEKPNQA